MTLCRNTNRSARSAPARREQGLFSVSRQRKTFPCHEGRCRVFRLSEWGICGESWRPRIMDVPPASCAGTQRKSWCPRIVDVPRRCRQVVFRGVLSGRPSARPASVAALGRRAARFAGCRRRERAPVHEIACRHFRCVSNIVAAAAGRLCKGSCSPAENVPALEGA